jgi:SAM-dependent methyltransferase
MPDGAHGRGLRQRLVAGEAVEDAELDRAWPPWVAALSEVHWTPVEVARRAAAFLTADRGSGAKILDVGSGAGKFCLVAAATTGASFVGVERNPRLVDEARRLATALDLENVAFRAGLMEDIDWSPFDGFYFYNPFGEQFLEEEETTLEPGAPRGWPVYAHAVRTALAKLYLTRPGTRVVTYHGLGAALPPGFELVKLARIHDGLLRFYVRLDPLTLERSETPDDFFDKPGLFDDEPTAMVRVGSRARTGEG